MKNYQEMLQSMARQARKKAASGIYHIMLRGINRQTVFEDNEDAAKFIDLLSFYKKRSGFAFLAIALWAIMSIC